VVGRLTRHLIGAAIVAPVMALLVVAFMPDGAAAVLAC
jgi:hypothetical protein